MREDLRTYMSFLFQLEENKHATDCRLTKLALLFVTMVDPCNLYPFLFLASRPMLSTGETKLLTFQLTMTLE